MTEENSHPDQRARLEQLSKFRIETVHGVKQDIVFSSYPEGMTVEENLSTDDYVKKIVGWHHDRTRMGISYYNQNLVLIELLPLTLTI